MKTNHLVNLIFHLTLTPNIYKKKLKSKIKQEISVLFVLYVNNTCVTS